MDLGILKLPWVQRSLHPAVSLLQATEGHFEGSSRGARESSLPPFALLTGFNIVTPFLGDLQGYIREKLASLTSSTERGREIERVCDRDL